MRDANPLLSSLIKESVLKVRILQAFQTFKIGQVFDWADGMANVFVARGLATPVEERSVESPMLGVS